MAAVLQLRVFLVPHRGCADPGIFRRLLVADTLTFYQLHCILQLSFGWTNSHCHQFESPFEPNLSITNLGESYDETERITDSRKVKIRPYLHENAFMVYTYDMGDYWQHGIFVEQVKEAEPGHTYPVCVEGAKSCPPEDCGGMYGYWDLVAAMKKGKGLSFQEYVRWLGSVYDPLAFDLTEINKKLSGWKRYSRQWEADSFVS